MDAGRAPVAWPSSHRSQRAASRSSPLPNTACHTTWSVADVLSLAASFTVTPLEASATAPP